MKTGGKVVGQFMREGRKSALGGVRRGMEEAFDGRRFGRGSLR